MIGKHLRRLAIAFCLESAIYAIVLLPIKHPPWAAVFFPVLLPGAFVTFFLGGGMSMIDGISPEWRVDFAFAIGFLTNTAIMYGLYSAASRIFKESNRYSQARSDQNERPESRIKGN